MKEGAGGIILMIFGGISMILAMISNNTPQAILGAMLYYQGLKC